MAKAQVLFSGEKCQELSKRKRLNFSIAHLGIYGIPAKPDYLKPFEDAVDQFKRTYEHGWAVMDTSQKDAFCARYYSDVNYDIATFQVPPSEFYLQYLAPLSDEGLLDREKKIKRAEKVRWLAIFGQFLSLAAQVSAGHDAIQTGNAGLREGRQGNINAMNAQMSESMSLYDASTNFANVGQYFSSTASLSKTADTSGVGLQLGGGLSGNMQCQTLLHFSNWNAPPDAEIWRTYRSFSADCEALNRLRVR